MAKAKQLLAEAGYPDGFDIEMHCLPMPEWMPPCALGMKENLAEIGIRVDVTILPIETMWSLWDKVPFIYTNWSHRPFGDNDAGLGVPQIVGLEHLQMVP